MWSFTLTGERLSPASEQSTVDPRTNATARSPWLRYATSRVLDLHSLRILRAPGDAQNRLFARSTCGKALSNWRVVSNVAFAVVARSTFSEPRCCEHEEADWTDREHLERVPDADEDDDVEPARSSVFDERAAPVRDGEVWECEHHRGHTPAESTPRTDPVEQNVARHVPTKEMANLNTGGPEHTDHYEFLSRITIAMRRCVESGLKACRERPKVSEEAASMSGYAVDPTLERASTIALAAPGRSRATAHPTCLSGRRPRRVDVRDPVRLGLARHRSSAP